jgi:hypothetical protein
LPCSRFRRRRFLLLPLLGVVLQGTSSVLYASVGEFVAPDRLPRTFRIFLHDRVPLRDCSAAWLRIIGDRFGVGVSIATMGVLVLLTVPLAALLKPRYAAAPQG